MRSLQWRCRQNLKLALVALLTIFLSAGLEAGDTLSPGQSEIAQLKGTRSDIEIELKPDRLDATYTVGDVLTLTLSSSRDVYLTVLDIGSSSRVTVLVPNARLPQLRAFARTPMHIPPSGAPFTIRVGGPAGFELIKVIATTEPVDVLAREPAHSVGELRSLDEQASELARKLPAILDSQVRAGYAVADVVIRVVDRNDPPH